MSELLNRTITQMFELSWGEKPEHILVERNPQKNLTDLKKIDTKSGVTYKNVCRAMRESCVS